MKYKVFVDDNFRYMEESERYALGEYATLDNAIAACKKIVDEFLLENYKDGMTSDELSAQYALYGEDPFIIGADNKVPFSARDYASIRVEEICQFVGNHTTLDDRHQDFNPFSSDCGTCRHFIGDKYSCAAFPKGIPLEILSGEIKHRNPIEGQENSLYVYEKKEFKSIPNGYINASGRFIDAEFVTIYRLLSEGNDDVACYRCTHWHGEDKDDRCDAFPKGIPKEITKGIFRHDKPFPNEENPQDKGIMFAE